MNSFQAKIGWKRMRKIEIKIFVPFRSYPTRNTEFEKNSQKIKNIKKIPMLRHFWQKQVGKGCERDKIKVFVPFRSVLTRNRKFKKSRKKFKKLKNTIMDSFQAIIGWKRMRYRENKNYRSVSFIPNA